MSVRTRNRRALRVLETDDPPHLRVKFTIEGYRLGCLEYPVRLEPDDLDHGPD